MFGELTNDRVWTKTYAISRALVIAVNEEETELGTNITLWRMMQSQRKKSFEVCFHFSTHFFPIVIVVFFCFCFCKAAGCYDPAAVVIPPNMPLQLRDFVSGREDSSGMWNIFVNTCKKKKKN